MRRAKPIRRSEQLAPLSREHHGLLLFSRKIKKGLKNGVPAKEITTYVKWYWNNYLQTQIRDEENLLLPYLPSRDEIANRLRKEHAGIKGLITGELQQESLALLADTIDHNIHFKEEQLLPHIEQRLSLEQLQCIRQQHDEQTQSPEKWDKKFWVKKK